MYKHILMPIELGTKAEETLAKARCLLAEGGKITLLHVVEPIPNYVAPYMPPNIYTESMEGAREKLAARAQELGLSDTALLQGPVGRGIVEWATENAADCIVLASHQPALSDIFLGSTAAWVVRHAQCAVLVLR